MKPMDANTSSSKLATLDIASMIDHSLLRPTLTEEEFLDGIKLAREYHCATVCVAPYDAARASQLLAGSGVRVSTVVDFPHGSNLTEVKVFETEKAIGQGASELDMVLAVSRLVVGHFDYVEQDIRAVVDVAHAQGAVLKVILETCYLDDDRIVEGCRICEHAGADYVKTSTGYGPAGATLRHVRLMRKSCSSRVAVKAAGGIRTLDEVLQYRLAGAKMIGTRASARILDEAARREKEGTLHDLRNDG